MRAAVTYVAGVQGEAAKAVAAAALKDRDPVVRRRAAEALVRMGQSPDKPSLAPVADIYALLNDPDRFVRWAGRIALEHTARAEWKDRVIAETNPLGALEGMLAWVRTANGESLQPLLDKQFGMLKQTNLSTENKLRLYRTFMYTTTEVKDGLSAAQREQLNGLIIGQFPSPDERINRELALMLGYAGQAAAIAKILAAIPKTNDNQELQLHYLYALRMIKQGWTADDKIAARRGARARLEVARRRAVHQLRRPVLRLGLRPLRDRRREAAALREGAGLLAAHASRARRYPGAPGRRGGRRPRAAAVADAAAPAGAPRRADRRARAQPAGDVRGDGLSAAAGARRRGRPEGVRSQLRVVPQVRLGRHRPRRRRA